MTQIDELIEERKSEILQIIEAQDIEDKDEFIEVLKKYYDSLPTSRIYTPDKKFTRALSFASADFSGQTGERVELAVLGYTNPRDWNEESRNKILDAWEKGQVAQEKLISEGKVMTLKTRDGRVVVSEIYNMAKSDSGEWIVLEGKELEGDEQPIPRDNREKITYANGQSYENNNYGNKLGSRWSMTMFALTSDGKKDIYCEVDIGGPFADPFSEQFVRKKAPALNFYDATIFVDEDKSKEGFLKGKSLQAIAPKTIYVNDIVEKIIDGEVVQEEEKKELPFDEYIYSLVDGVELEDGLYKPIRDFKEYMAMDEEDREEIEDSIFLVDLGDLEYFHELIAKRESDGTPSMTASGKNYSLWNKFALSVPVLNAVKEASNGNTQLILNHRGTTKNAFLDPTFPEIKGGKCECMISFNTVKLSTRWDREQRKQIKDPNNGDVNIANIFGFKKTFVLD